MSDRYGITADELHTRVIADLRDYCEHFSFDIPAHVWENEAARPLEQTIRMVCTAINLTEGATA